MVVMILIDLIFGHNETFPLHYPYIIGLHQRGFQTGLIIFFFTQAMSKVSRDRMALYIGPLTYRPSMQTPFSGPPGFRPIMGEAGVERSRWDLHVCNILIRLDQPNPSIHGPQV